MAAKGSVVRTSARRNRADRSGGIAVGQGVAAVLAAAGLLVTGMTAAHADTAPTAATATTMRQ